MMGIEILDIGARKCHKQNEELTMEHKAHYMLSGRSKTESKGEPNSFWGNLPGGGWPLESVAVLHLRNYCSNPEARRKTVLSTATEKVCSQSVHRRIVVTSRQYWRAMCAMREKIPPESDSAPSIMAQKL